MKMKLFIALLAIVVGGCSTNEYRQTEASCKSQWTYKLPVDNKQIVVNRVRHETVNDGPPSCYTTPVRCQTTTQVAMPYYHKGWQKTHCTGGRTSCTQPQKTIEIPYTEVVTVDQNESERWGKIKNCTRQRCRERYGNSRCETTKQKEYSRDKSKDESEYSDKEVCEGVYEARRPFIRIAKLRGLKCPQTGG